VFLNDNDDSRALSTNPMIVFFFFYKKPLSQFLEQIGTSRTNQSPKKIPNTAHMKKNLPNLGLELGQVISLMQKYQFVAPGVQHNLVPWLAAEKFKLVANTAMVVLPLCTCL
jgi:hypothetical protein